VKTFRALLITSLMTLPSLWAYGQQTGEVTATVTGATGALVAEANVAATNLKHRRNGLESWVPAGNKMEPGNVKILPRAHSCVAGWRDIP
jgi:hypothetical protein